MKVIIRNFLITLFALSFAACTKPAETTGMGAGAGAAIGAGLGAIVGSQTGDAGSGLAIGALAGAAGGGLVGNVLQAQDEKIALQDEKLTRQERALEAQRREMDRLKGINGDDPKARLNMKSYKRSTSAGASGGTSYMTRNKTQKSYSLNNIDDPKASCREAESEVTSARLEGDSATKLFHLRRALRLCPDNADYHAELARAYKNVGRADDAEYEIEEALKLDPDNSLAKAER